MQCKSFRNMLLTIILSTLAIASVQLKRALKSRVLSLKLWKVIWICLAMW